jgi:hypothetical protein
MGEIVLNVWPASGAGNIVVVPSAYKGTITKVQIIYGSSRLTVPASLKIGDRCELHAFGKLDPSSQGGTCGIRATITKPDGSQLTGYQNRGDASPGEELEYSIMNISIDESGTWVASVVFYKVT